MSKVPRTSVRRLTVLAIAIAAGLLIQSVSAQTPNQLVITENSPSDFSVTYNGTPLSAMSADDQTFFLPPAGVSFDTSHIPGVPERLGFTEPDNPALFNFVLAIGGGMGVHSDLPIAPFLPNGVTLFADGSSVGPVGFDQNNDIGILLTFYDKAASTESVPDSGSTLGLFSLALAALVGATRVHSHRLV